MEKRILESERLMLRPLSYNELYQISNNEMNNVTNIIEPEALSEAVKLAASKKIGKMQEACENVHEWYTYWLIINKENEKGIGFIGFKGLPDENGYVEVGYSISPEHRKKGFMTEALEVLVNWTEGDDACKGIAAKVKKTNVGSVKVLCNCNFKLGSTIENEEIYIIEFK